MPSRTSLSLINISYYVFAAIFGWIFLHILFANQIYSFNTLFVLASIIGWSIATAGIYKLINRFNAQLASNPHAYSLGILSIVFFVQLYLGYQLAVETAWDVEAVYKGAKNLTEHGALGSYQGYMQLFPHNIGSTLILSWLFTFFSYFGINDYYWIGTIYNILSINVGFYLVFLICKELKDSKTAFIALWLCLAYIPLYFYAPVFYTDTLSFPFVALTYYLYLRVSTCKNNISACAVAVALGLACALGGMIKFTSVIIAIAIILEIIILGKTRKYFLPILVSIASFLCITFSLNNYVSNNILPKEAVIKDRVPYSHWVMMGLEGNGSYNGGDYQFTYSFSDPKEKVQGNIRVIEERLKNYGLLGYLDFVTRKQQLNFGNGTFAVNEMLDDSPIRKNYLHEFCLDGGKHFAAFKNISQGLHVFIFILIILSALYDAISKNKFYLLALAPRIGIFGIFFFLMLWEASSRYIINFIPVFVICAALGYENIHRIFFSVKKTIKKDIDQAMPYLPNNNA